MCRRARGRGRDRRRGHGHRSVGDRQRVPSAPVRVQDRHRDLPPDVCPRDEPEDPGDPYPQTLAELIAFNAAPSGLEGPWNDAVFEAAEATNGRDADCAALREATTPPVQDAIDELMADNDLDAIVALTNGPAWPTNDNPDEGDLDGHFEYFVGSSSAAAVSGYADITVPAGYTRDCRSGSPSSAAAGPSRSCSALPTTTSRQRTFAFRRSSSRRSATPCSPASQTRCWRWCSGSRRPRVSAISSFASGRGIVAETTKPGPFGRASCCLAECARR